MAIIGQSWASNEREWTQNFLERLILMPNDRYKRTRIKSCGMNVHANLQRACYATEQRGLDTHTHTPFLTHIHTHTHSPFLTHTHTNTTVSLTRPCILTLNGECSRRGDGLILVNGCRAHHLLVIERFVGGVALELVPRPVDTLQLLALHGVLVLRVVFHPEMCSGFFKNCISLFI